MPSVIFVVSSLYNTWFHTLTCNHVMLLENRLLEVFSRERVNVQLCTHSVTHMSRSVPVVKPHDHTCQGSLERQGVGGVGLTQN